MREWLHNAHGRGKGRLQEASAGIMEKRSMSWIEWDDTLELGHAGMDADHQRLVALVNQLADGIVRHPGQDAYNKLLDELFAQARARFDHEEQLMATHHYPHAEEHTAKHTKLMTTALEYRTKFDADAQPSVSLLFYFEQ